MEDVFNFLKAALPWIAIGFLLAVFFARNARKKKNEEQHDTFGTEGICLGTAIGTSIKKEGQNNDEKE